MNKAKCVENRITRIKRQHLLFTCLKLQVLHVIAREYFWYNVWQWIRNLTKQNMWQPFHFSLDFFLEMSDTSY